MNKKIAIFFGLLMIIGMGTGFWFSRTETRDIEANLETTFGEIIRIYSQNSRGKTVEYQFEVNGNEYIGHQTFELGLNVGDTCLIEYSRINPEHNRALFEISEVH
jgi:hypothetical protein